MMTVEFSEIWRSAAVEPLFIPVGHYAMIDGIRTHYLEKGEGKPVLLVHGLGSYSYTWRYNIDQLAQHFKVYALDLKGFGLSDKPRRTGYAVQDQVDLVRKFIEQIGQRPVHFVGSSMGGEIGLRICLDHPDLIDRLVLVASSGYRDRIPWYLRMLGYLPYTIPIKSYIRKKYLKEELLGQVVKEAFYDPGILNPKELKNYLYPMYTKGFQEAFLNLLRNFDFGKRMRDYHLISQPSLIIAGSHDRVIPIEHLQRLNQELNDSTLITIENAGHFLHEERPEKVNDLVIQFLLGK